MFTLKKKSDSHSGFDRYKQSANAKRFGSSKFSSGLNGSHAIRSRAVAFELIGKKIRCASIANGLYLT